VLGAEESATRSRAAAQAKRKRGPQRRASLSLLGRAQRHVDLLFIMLSGGVIRDHDPVPGPLAPLSPRFLPAMLRDVRDDYRLCVSINSIFVVRTVNTRHAP